MESIGRTLGANMGSIGDQFRDMVQDAPYKSQPKCGFEERGTERQIGELYAALATARANFGPIEKSKTVTIPGKYKFDYAPMEVLLVATVKPLAEQGLVVMLPYTGGEGSKVTQLAIIAHKGGGRLVFTYEFSRVADEKGFGGQLTYLQRYAYRSALSLAADGDLDDMPDERRGETQAVATPRQAPAQQSRPAPQQQRPQSQPQAPSQPAAAPAGDLDGAKHAQYVKDAQAALRACGASDRSSGAKIVAEAMGWPFPQGVRPLGDPYLSSLSVSELEKVLEHCINLKAKQ